MHFALADATYGSRLERNSSYDWALGLCYLAHAALRALLTRNMSLIRTAAAFLLRKAACREVATNRLLRKAVCTRTAAMCATSRSRSAIAHVWA